LASSVTAASRESISASSNHLSDPAKSFGKKWRGGEGCSVLASEAARDAGVLAVGLENRSGVFSFARW
jgi:hypothetical protein